MRLEPIAPVLVAAPAAVLLAVWSLVAAFRSVHPARAWAVAGLRVLAILALAGGLLRPVVSGGGPSGATGTPIAPLRPVGLVLAERSGPELAPGPAARIGRLEREGLVVRIAFPGASGTDDFRASAADALARCTSAPRSALFVLGRSASDPAAPAVAARLARAGVAVSAVVPAPEARPGLSLSRLSLRPREPRAGGPVVAAAELAGRLPGATTVEVRWTLDGRSLASREVALPAGSTRRRIEHAFSVPTSGFHRVRVELAPLPGETDLRDNAAGAFLLARPGQRRALAVEGPPREVYRALRRALESDDGFRVSSSSAVERPRRARLLPREEHGWSGLDLVIVGDLAAPEFAPGELDRLARFVREGGGLVVVAGGRNLGPGGWGATALVGVLPVKVGPDDGAVPGPIDVRPAGRVGQARPFPFGAGWDGGPGGEDETRTFARSGASSWRELAELARARAVAAVARGARVPIVGVRPGLKVPLLAEGRAGSGRVTVVLSDDIGRWARSSPAARLAHDEFWRDIARGVARASPDEGPRVWLECPPLAARSGLEAGRSIPVTVYLADASAGVRLEIERPGAPGGRTRETVKLPPRGLVRTFELGPRGPGRILLRARAGSGTSAATSAPLEIEVRAPAGEPPERERAPDPGAAEGVEELRAVCIASGGVLSTEGSASGAVEAFGKAVARAGADRAGPDGDPAAGGETADALPAGAWLALFVAFLVAEWSLRREWGMP